MATSEKVHTPLSPVIRSGSDSVATVDETPAVTARLYRAGHTFAGRLSPGLPRANAAACAALRSAPPNADGLSVTVTPPSSPVSAALTVPEIDVDVFFEVPSSAPAPC